MGLGDFIMIIDKFGTFGVVAVLIFCAIQFIGSVVDIYQFLEFHGLRRDQKLEAIAKRLDSIESKLK